MNDKPSRFRLSNLLWSIACFAAIFAIIRFNLRLGRQTGGTMDNWWLIILVLSPVPIAALFCGGIGVLFGRFMQGAALGLTSIFVFAVSWVVLLLLFYS